MHGFRSLSPSSALISNKRTFAGGKRDTIPLPFFAIHVASRPENSVNRETQTGHRFRLRRRQNCASDWALVYWMMQFMMRRKLANRNVVAYPSYGVIWRHQAIINSWGPAEYAVHVCVTATSMSTFYTITESKRSLHAFLMNKQGRCFGTVPLFAPTTSM
jgi:hypothetical protein